MSSLHPIMLSLVAGTVLVAQKPDARPVSTREAAIQQTIAANRKGAKAKPQQSTGGLMPWEEERVRIFQVAKGSVVHITSLGIVPAGGASKDETAVPLGTGSGFVWDNAGHVVTNHHVVQGADQVKVRLLDGKEYEAQVIGRSVAYDTAVLHVFAPLDQLKPITLGRSKDLQVGQSTLAIGNPFGLDHTLSQGIVSALDRSIRTTYNSEVRGVIQTDAAINPGNSGGPLLDSRGRFIGMNTAIANATGASVGIGFAIPVDLLNTIVPDLIAKGRISGLYLGFACLKEDSTRALGFGMGAAVGEVDAGGPAADAGLKAWQIKGNSVTSPGDVIIRCQGEDVANDSHLFAILEKVKPGQEVVLEVWRNGSASLVTLRLKAERAKKPIQEVPDKPTRSLGEI